VLPDRDVEHEVLDILDRKQANGSWVYSVTRKPRTVQSFSAPHAVRMRNIFSGWFCFMQASLSG
jgi:hypothetical protein